MKLVRSVVPKRVRHMDKCGNVMWQIGEVANLICPRQTRCYVGSDESPMMSSSTGRFKKNA